MQFLKNYAKDESGATAIEYGLIAAAVALVLVSVMPGISGQLRSVFGAINSGLTTAVNAANGSGG